MAFNVYEMLGTLDEAGGFTKASKFFVEIYPPRALAVSPTLFFLCESSNLPGITLQTEDVKVYGYGVNEKRASGIDFNGNMLPLSFFNDSNGKVLTFFHRWIQSIYNFNLNINPAGTSRGVPMNTLSYPKEYYGIVNISHFDDSGEQIIQYTLNEAYPVAIGDVPVDWGLSDQIVRIPISFAYGYWTAETLDPGVVDERSRANYYATQSVQTRTDFELKAVRELLFITSPSQTNRTVNQLSNLITFL
jgi:hypothetical protein